MNRECRPWGQKKKHPPDLSGLCLLFFFFFCSEWGPKESLPKPPKSWILLKVGAALIPYSLFKLNLLYFSNMKNWRHRLAHSLILIDSIIIHWKLNSLIFQTCKEEVEDTTELSLKAQWFIKDSARLCFIFHRSIDVQKYKNSAFSHGGKCYIFKCDQSFKFKPDGHVSERCDSKWDNMRKKHLHQSAEPIPQCSAVWNRWLSALSCVVLWSPTHIGVPLFHSVCFICPQNEMGQPHLLTWPLTSYSEALI